MAFTAQEVGKGTSFCSNMVGTHEYEKYVDNMYIELPIELLSFTVALVKQ